MDIHEAGVVNRMKKVVSTKYKNHYSGPTDFKAAQFHFHLGSRITIDGWRFDVEMHNIHIAE